MIRQTLSTAFVGLVFVALLALMIVSVEEIYTVVISGLFSSTHMEKILFVGALLAAVIPAGNMIVNVYVLGRVIVRSLITRVYRLGAGPNQPN